MRSLENRLYALLQEMTDIVADDNNCEFHIDFQYSE